MPGQLTASYNLLKELRAMGSLYASSGNFKRAEAHYKLALKLYETSFPDSHVDAMVCLQGLIEVLEQQGKHEDALKAKNQVPLFNQLRRHNNN
jgi:hypothetical protein